MNLMEWSLFFDQLYVRWHIWQFTLLVLIILPLLVKLCAQAQIESYCEPSIKSLSKLIFNCFPLLNKIRVYILSRRFDLWTSATIGLFCALVLSNNLNFEILFNTKHNREEPFLDINADYWTLLYGLLLPLGLLMLNLWDSAIDKINQCDPNRLKKSAANRDCIQTDSPIETNDSDLFGWKEKAEVFSKAVLAAPDGTAFGVEAPWGTGKTSFINLCEWNWQKPCIVYRFEILKYVGSTNLIKEFVLSLFDQLEKTHYLPELRGAIQGYLAGLQGTLELNGGPLKITLKSQPNSIEDALQQIAAQLERRLQKNIRIIVVIDDLDRVAPENVRDLLFALHKCFALPRLRYVLCYDQQQLAHKAELHRQHGGDLASQTLYEFLDKFVSGKIYLHSTYHGLESHVKKLLLTKSKSNFDTTSVWNSFVEEIFTVGVLALLKEIDFKYPNETGYSIKSINTIRFEKNHIYWSMLGNIRQLNWLFNQINLCLQKGIDLKKHEFNARDLVYLLLLQQLFPDLFRRIRAQAHSGEYLSLCKKNENNEQDVSELDIFIQTEQERYHENPWAKAAIEALLRDLFTQNNKYKITSNTSKSDYRATDGYRLPTYFNLLLQEKIPPLHSSGAYLVWIKKKWREGDITLEHLLSDDVLKQHNDKSDDWNDENEYSLWEFLFEKFEQYTIPEQDVLSIEFLKSLPRFESPPQENFIKSRVDMANIIASTTRRVTLENKQDLAQSIINRIWFQRNYGLLEQSNSILSLLGWQDAMVIYQKLQDSGLNGILRNFIQREFWEKFNAAYPRMEPFGKLKELEIALKGNRKNDKLQQYSNPRRWLVKHWEKMYYLTALGPDSEAREKNHEEIENLLFKKYWGESNPNEEQLCWWMDYILYNTPLNGINNNYQLPHKEFNIKLQKYANKHTSLIKKLQEKHYQSESEFNEFTTAMNKLCGMPWHELQT
ncbi:KAP family P-loop NTPase fold protein [Chromobacterium alticapitis]|nr:P-loop NTPase fold protein [Chromobacterium alticapitis]